MSPFTPCVFYRDPKTALRWLEQAFGFEVSMLIEDVLGRLPDGWQNMPLKELARQTSGPETKCW